MRSFGIEPLPSHDLTHLAQRGDYLFSKVFVSFAHRERVRTRALDDIIPYYRTTQTALSQGDTTAAPASTAPPSYAYTRLERFLKLVDPQAVEIIFVAMPLREPYTLDPKLPQLIESAGAHFIDIESVPRLAPQHYRDSLHLLPPGAKIYSQRLGRELAALLPHAP